MISLISLNTHDPKINGPLMPFLAVENCSNLKMSSKKKKKEALEVAKKIYKIEEEMKIPDTMRGMTLAAACKESGFNPNAKGDRKFSKSKKKPMAIGVFQLWPFYERAYDVDRKDPESSARAWLKHIMRQLPGVKKKCKYRTIRKIWVAAWVTGIRYKKAGGRCKERPLHLKYFLKLKRIYKKESSKPIKIKTF